MSHMNEQPDKNMPPIPKPAVTENFEEAVGDPWSVEFTLALTENDVFAIALAANYLELNDLKDLMCCRIVVWTKGKDIQGIRDVFQIENDFEGDEEAQVKAEIDTAMENFWIEMRKKRRKIGSGKFVLLTRTKSKYLKIKWS